MTLECEKYCLRNEEPCPRPGIGRWCSPTCSFMQAARPAAVEYDSDGKIPTDFGYFSPHPLYAPGKTTPRPAAVNEPIPGKKIGTVVIDEVTKDLKDRSVIGKIKYSQRLRSYNGRNALMDAYQEALDLVMYLKQKLLEEQAENHCACGQELQHVSHCKFCDNDE